MKPRGFTLLEVMIALALLGFGLVVLIRSTASNVYAARDAQMMGVVTDLSRGKMYDIEELLLKDGFTDSDQSEEGESFSDEGYPTITYSYLVEEVELPTFEEIQNMAGGRGAAAGSGAGSDAGSDGDEGGGGFANSALGGMLMMGDMASAGSADTAEGQAGASFIQTYYPMIQETLKVSIRKVTLDVQYEVGGRKRELRTVAFFTDASAMDKVLQGMGANEQPAAGSGSASGSGTGTGGRPPVGGGRPPIGGAKPR